MDGQAGKPEEFYECRPGAAKRPLSGTYRRRDPESTVLHRAVRENLATFLDQAVEGGGLPAFRERDFNKYLDCGVLAHGFTRVACSTCEDEVLVAFSCKGRGFCPGVQRAPCA